MDSNSTKSLDEIAKVVADLSQKHKKYSFVSGFIGVLLGAGIQSGVDTSSFETIPMPDCWLKDVALLPVVSDKGLILLAMSLKKQGFVSLETAVRFIQHEQDFQKNVSSSDAEPVSPVILNTGEGAKQLLSRAGHLSAFSRLWNGF